MKVAPSSVAVCLELEVLLGSPIRSGLKAPVKLKQEQLMRGSKPGSSGTRSSPPNKTLTPGTDYSIDVYEYESEGDGLHTIPHEGVTVAKKKYTQVPRKNKASREAENPPKAPAVTPAPPVSSGPKPKHIVWFETQDWSPK